MSRDKDIKEMLSDAHFKKILMDKLYGDEIEQAGVLASDPSLYLEKTLKDMSDEAFTEIKTLFQTSVSSSKTDNDGNSVHILGQSNNVSVPEYPNAEFVYPEINNVSEDRYFEFGKDRADPRSSDHELARSCSPGSKHSDCEQDLVPLAVVTEPRARSPVEESVGQRRCQAYQCFPAESKCKNCHNPIDFNEVIQQIVELERKLLQAQEQIAFYQQSSESTKQDIENNTRITSYFFQKLQESKRKIWSLEQELMQLRNKCGDLECKVLEKEANETFYQERMNDLEALPKANLMFMEKLLKTNEELEKKLKTMQKEKEDLLLMIEAKKDEEHSYRQELFSIQNRLDEEVEKLRQAYDEMMRFSDAQRRNLHDEDPM